MALINAGAECIIPAIRQLCTPSNRCLASQSLFVNLATLHRADTQSISLGEASCMYRSGACITLTYGHKKKGKLTTSRRYNHPTVASVKTWRSSGGACRVGLTHHKSTTFFPLHQLYPPQNFHTPPFSPPFATISRNFTSSRHSSSSQSSSCSSSNRSGSPVFW